MIKIAICEDEKNIRDYLSALVQRQDYETEITQYASADAYLSADEEYDLLFLDIELEPSSQGGNTGFGKGQIDGMKLARRVRNDKPRRQPLILFVTGHEKYVYDAFDVDAFQYLLKPVDENRFAEVFRRAAERIAEKAQQAQKKLTLQYAGTTRAFPLDSIYYIESQGHKALLHLKDATVEYYARIGSLELELGGQFCRIHKGFLVNLAYVEEYSKSEVALANGQRLNLSKYKYDSFVKAYMHFIQ